MSVNKGAKEIVNILLLFNNSDRNLKSCYFCTSDLKVSTMCLILLSIRHPAFFWLEVITWQQLAGIRLFDSICHIRPVFLNYVPQDWDVFKISRSSRKPSICYQIILSNFRRAWRHKTTLRCYNYNNKHTFGKNFRCYIQINECYLCHLLLASAIGGFIA